MKQVWPAQRKQQAESVSCVRSRRWDCKWAFYTTGFSGLCTEHALRVIRRKKAEVPQRYAGRNESMQTTKESLGSGVHFLPGITSSPTTFPPHRHSQPEQKQHVLPLQTRFPHCSRRRAWSWRSHGGALGGAPCGSSGGNKWDRGMEFTCPALGSPRDLTQSPFGKVPRAAVRRKARRGQVWMQGDKVRVARSGHRP